MTNVRVRVEGELIANKDEENEDSKDLGIARLDALMDDLQIVEARPPNCLHSPFLHQLPPEIISYIFNFTLLDFSIFKPTPTKKNPPLKKDRTATPFILGAVCRDWRAITWSTPILWSSMVVQFSKFTLNSRRSTLVKDWLARSGHLPLSIRIFIKPLKLYRVVIEDLNLLAGIIKQYSSRWRHFELSAQSKIATFFRLGTEGPHSTPILESLRLDIPGRSNLQFDLVTCPRLQKLHLVSARLSFIKFSWNNVTHLCALAMSPGEYLEILRNTPLLVHAEFLSFLDAELSLPRGEIIVPLLQSLKVVGRCSTFLLHITCPALNEFIRDAQWKSFSTNYIIPFLKRCGQLRSFSMFDFVPTERSSWIDLLRAVPSINKLVLSQTRTCCTGMTAQRILEILDMTQFSQSNPSQPKFLPYLETFDCKVDVLDTIPLNPTHFFPSTDNAVRGPLQSIKLNTFPAIPMPKDVIAFFLRLVGRGVTVNVRSRSEDILSSSINYYKGKEEPLHRDDLDLGLMEDPCTPSCTLISN